MIKTDQIHSAPWLHKLLNGSLFRYALLSLGEKEKNQPACFFNMVVVEYKNVAHKAPFLVLTVGQKSLFSPLNFFFTPSPLLISDPSLSFVSSPSTYTIFLSSSVSFFFLLHSSHLSSPLSPSSSSSSCSYPGPAGLCGTNHQTAAPLSLLTEQLPPPQQYTTPLGQSTATVATIQDPHLANRGGGLGHGGPSGLMEGTRRVNY